VLTVAWASTLGARAAATAAATAAAFLRL